MDLLDHADPSPGYHEKVDRSLGGDILEGDTLVILVEELSRDGAVQDLVKDGSFVVLTEMSRNLADEDLILLIVVL